MRRAAAAVVIVAAALAGCSAGSSSATRKPDLFERVVAVHTLDGFKFTQDGSTATTGPLDVTLASGRTLKLLKRTPIFQFACTELRGEAVGGTPCYIYAGVEGDGTTARWVAGVPVPDPGGTGRPLGTGAEVNGRVRAFDGGFLILHEGTAVKITGATKVTPPCPAVTRIADSAWGSGEEDSPGVAVRVDLDTGDALAVGCLVEG